MPHRAMPATARPWCGAKATRRRPTTAPVKVMRSSMGEPRRASKRGDAKRTMVIMSRKNAKAAEAAAVEYP